MTRSNSVILHVFFALSTFYVFFITFYGIGEIPIYITDEHRNSINALEMFQSGNYWYTTYKFTPDFWNTKPPLLIWFQSFFMNLFGPGELAIRLPTAIMGLGIASLMYLFAARVLKSLWIGIIANLCLFSSNGFVALHGLRTGDYDVMLTFFVLAMVLSFYVYLKNKSSKAALFFSIALALAILTKGVAALLMLPGIFIFVVLKKQFISILKDRAFMMYLLIPVLTIIVYYGLRELLTPGYLNAIWLNELSGRYAEVNEGNSGGALFYLNILNSYFWGKKLLIIALLAIPLAFVLKKHSTVSLYIGICAVCFCIVLSISETKLYWYILPVYPLLSLLVGVSVVLVGKEISSRTRLTSMFESTVIAMLTALLVFSNVKQKSVETLRLKTEFPEEVFLDKLQQRAVKTGVNLDTSFTYLVTAKHIDFYERILKQDFKYLHINDKAILPHKIATGISQFKQHIEDFYEIADKKEENGIAFYVLKDSGNSFDKKLDGYDLSKLNADEKGFLFLRNKKDDTRALLLKKNVDSADAIFYYLDIYSNHDGQRYRSEFTIYDNWDSTDYNGYSLKFIQFLYPPNEGMISQKDENFNNVWLEKVTF